MSAHLKQVYKKLASPSQITTPVRKVALVLAGCGHRDGAEITEAVGLLVQLSAAGMNTKIFAPQRNLAGTVNHLTGEPSSDQRSILEEAARIARGQISSLDHCHARDFDALVFSGGFGVARNLCNFAFNGIDAKLERDVGAVLQDFFTAKRAIGALCIAPVLLALYGREAGLKGLSLTLGDGSAKEAIQAIEAWGAKHVACGVREACVDPVNRVVTAPAYMDDRASPFDVFQSATVLVDGLRELLD